ncbi:Vps51/Vps67-domain-containing protein [Mycena albidolilacea]|uniref:Vacuolar protein sorting-associated protein 51 homolog n=1 Tax=Mycena albidolilacea TaxID=1033008 RepID=A0AAD7ANM3_9AGAR|nr:Vps51/Vps67-domain-containing protein [Mycena albidolilacea]
MSTTSSPPATPRKASIPRPPPSPLRPASPAASSHNTIVPSQLSTGALSPRRMPSSPPPTGAGTKTRARDLLRKHYGLGVGPPPSVPGKSSQDPMNLDSSAFDAKSYYEQLITTASLPALLKRENELLVEIRELDSERQSLVYNHHHELIAASDTIAAMKTRAESLDADLDLLRVAFSEISRLASEVVIEDTPSGGGNE